MITKNWTDNWAHRLRIAFVLSFITAILAGGIPAYEWNKTTSGWYFSWLHARLLSKTPLGNYGLVAKLNMPPRPWLRLVCDANPNICSLYVEKTDKFLMTYPAIGAVSMAALFFFLLIAMGSRRRQSNEQHRRGARVVEAKELQKLLRREPADIMLGGVPFPRRDETRHLLLAGSPGSGKTVAFNTILQILRNRGDRAIVIDAGGAFLQKFARQGDVLLNPFDKRSQKWSPFADATTTWEIEAMARSLIPPGEGSNKVWQDLAKTVLAGLMEQCAANGIATNNALAVLATCANPQVLANVLRGHPAESLVGSGSPSTVGSILTNLGEASAGLRYLNQDAGSGSFSIRDWVREGDGWMFVSFQVGQREALKHIMAAQLDVVARTVLDLLPDESRRIWLIVDEAPLLGKVNSLVEFLSNGRRFGGCAVIGIQAISQLRDAYGREGAATMLSCLSSQLVLRAADGETAEQMSKLLGEKEILRRTRSEGKTEQGSSMNEQEQITQTRAVLASQLQNLKDLHGYFNIVGDRPVASVCLQIPKIPDGVNQPFVAAQMPARRAFTLPASMQSDSCEVPAPREASVESSTDWREHI